MITRASAITILAAIVAVPAAAAPQPAMLDCAVSAAPPKLIDDLARAATDTAMADRETPKIEFSKIVSGCIERFTVVEPLRQSYARYALARVVREKQAVMLKAAGLDPAIGERALGLGPGKFLDFSNGIPEETTLKIVNAYVATGIDAEKVPPANWELLGGYAAMTSLMWAMLADLEQQ